MRGILMIEPLYHQTVRGLKTQTRRSSGLEQVNGREAVVKKGVVIKEAIEANPDDFLIQFINIKGNAIPTASFFGKSSPVGEIESIEFRGIKSAHNPKCKPRYQVGEILYIKEPYAEVFSGSYYMYKYADNPMGLVPEPDGKWKNKLFMPAEAARAFIRITGIRCERLLDISDEDCVAEGIEKQKGTLNGQPTYPIYGSEHKIESGPFVSRYVTDLPKDSFLSLYKFANKAKEVPNLWVFCYEFEYLPNYKI